MKHAFNLSEEERKKIMEKHAAAKKIHDDKKEDLKKGLQKPIKKDKKTS